MWLATESELMPALVALPLTSVTGLPKSLPSIRNCTVPLGVPEPGALAATLAVKVTVCPGSDVVAEGTKLVVVLSWLTAWVSVPSLAPKLAAPL